MLSNGIKKYLSNPIFGLLPCIIYIVLHELLLPEGTILIACLILAVVSEIIIRTYYKTRAFSITFWMSIIALGLTLIIWIFVHDHSNRSNIYLIICEIILVCLFMLLRASKVYISKVFFRRKNLLEKALLNEFYESVTFIQYAFTLHIFIVVLYRQFIPDNFQLDPSDVVVFAIIPIVMFLAVGIYQAYKVTSLASKLKKEEWLPIVTEKGEVTGKIAKSVSVNMKNKFLHPVVRVALVFESKVYLQERPMNDILSPGKLDYPFEKYMLFNHEINLAARNSIRKMVGNDVDIPISFLLKYVFENEDTKRLIFLFIARIDDEDKIKREGKMTGKFWSVKQLEEQFADEIFSECFELEFEYLKNMVLQPSDIFDKSN